MKIEIKDNSAENVAKRFEFPANCEYFGNDEFQDYLKIFIREDALKRVDEYLSSDTNNELGGVFVGKVGLSSSGDNFILIDDLIIAKHTSSSISRLTFTHETWDYINQILEKDFPGQKILGWFHSHPGHTVFLSNYDMFIQENFFNMEYMVAYVFDPTINDRGFFSWANKKIVKSGGYYVCDIVKQKEPDKFLILDSDSELLNIETPGKIKSKSFKPDYKNFVTMGLFFFTLLMLLFIIYNIYDFKQKALLKEEYEKDLAVIKSENKKLTERLNEYVLESELRKKSTNTAGNVAQEELNSNVDKSISTNSAANNNTLTDSNINNNNPGNTKVTPPPVTDAIVSITKYIVKKGDTLEKISNQFYKSRIGINLIMKHNKIKNKADLTIGQELNLPDVKQ